MRTPLRIPTSTHPLGPSPTRLLLAACLLALPATARAVDPLPAMQILQTPGGTRFGLFGSKPATPAPTLFVLAGGLEDVDKTRIYSDAGKMLAPEGWICVTVDLPCHGRDHRDGEPAGIAGWPHRVKAGEDLMAPFIQRCVQTLDYLIAEKYTLPEQVAVCGTSRGGFSALHFAAAEPRVRVVAAVSPVTNPLAITEFAWVTEEQARNLQVTALADKLAGRALWLSIGNDDARVNTDDCVTAARQFAAAAKKQSPPASAVPVEFIVGISAGHSAIDNAYGLAADFVRKHCAAPAKK